MTIRPGYPANRHENKLAEMSYASSWPALYPCATSNLTSYTAVQGKDALVDKFRNSPVILNTPDNRPKVEESTLIWNGLQC